MDSRAGLDDIDKSKNLLSIPAIEPRFLGLPARSLAATDIRVILIVRTVLHILVIVLYHSQSNFSFAD